MTVFSSLTRSAATLALTNSVLRAPTGSKILQNAIQFRQMGGHGHKTMFIKPSRFQWDKFKDMLHYFVMIGLIPITVIVAYCNIFVGPAQLAEIPKDYEPKHWEYHSHPISRFLARYIYPSPQQEYEKMCHAMFEENEKAQLRKLEREVKAKMADRQDYQAYYYHPAITKYHKVSKEAADYLESIRGD
ncbi:NDUFB5 family protein [Megaselia abdita]